MYIKMIVCEVDCKDPIDRSMFIPKDKITRIYLNADGGDAIYVGDEEYYCKNGQFNLQEISALDYA